MAPPTALPTEPNKAEPTKAALAPASATPFAPTPTPMTTTAPRARIVSRRDSQEARARGASAAEATVPTAPTPPPHDWAAIERRRKLAQARAAQTGARLHAGGERRQAHLEALKKEVLRAEAVEAPLQPTFYTPAKFRGGNSAGAGSRRSSFGDRLCPRKEHMHHRSLSREQRSQQLDLRGCTFQPAIHTRAPRKQQPSNHPAKRGGSAPPAPVARPHKDDDSVSTLSSGSAAGARAAGGDGRRSSGPSVFERNHEFGQIYKMRREKRKEELRKAVRACKGFSRILVLC